MRKLPPFQGPCESETGSVDGQSLYGPCRRVTAGPCPLWSAASKSTDGVGELYAGPARHESVGRTLGRDDHVQRMLIGGDSEASREGASGDVWSLWSESAAFRFSIVAAPSLQVCPGSKL